MGLALKALIARAYRPAALAILLYRLRNFSFRGCLISWQPIE
jgi:hypothetical protein